MSKQDTYQHWFHSALPAAPTSMHPFWRKVHEDEALTSKLSRIPSQPRGASLLCRNPIKRLEPSEYSFH